MYTNNGELPMGWNFRRSVKIAPGVRLNLGKRGTSLSFGIRGLRTTIGNGRVTSTVGIPGSGASFTTSRRVTSVAGESVAVSDHISDREKTRQHPARVEFYRKQIESRRTERIIANGGVVPHGPLICPTCLYERRPKDIGPLLECVDCGSILSKSKPLSSRPTRRWKVIGILFTLAIVASLVFWLRN
jgi:Protein of unknown function (DUF4236)